MRILVGKATLLTLVLSGLTACAATQSDSSKGKPVATIGGQPVYEQDLLARVQNDLLKLRNEEYQIKYRGLQNLILQRLLEAEAKKRNLTVEQFVAQEVDSKAAEPTDAEIQAQYKQQQDQRKFEDIKEEYRRSLKQSRVRLARQTYFRQLWDAAGVTILLEPPRVQVAHDSARVRGNPNAPVMIVEFSDFQCTYCRRVQPTLLALLAKYPNQIAISYRDFPLRDIHAQAQLAAEAARCAGEEGKFWEYHDRLFALPPAFEKPVLQSVAQAVGLDAKRFATCLDSGKFRAAVEEDMRDGNLAGVGGTPAFFINGLFLDGAQPQAEFEKIIDAELAKKK